MTTTPVESTVKVCIRACRPEDYKTVAELFLAGMRSYITPEVEHLVGRFEESLAESVNGDLASIQETYFDKGGFFWVATVEEDEKEVIVGIVGLDRKADNEGLLVTILAATFLSATQSYRSGDQVCSYTDDNACPIESLKGSNADGSVLIYPGGNTRCAFDDYKDPKTGFSTNSTYFSQVFPKPERKKLLMFQGGGGCIDISTCNFAIQCSLGTSQTFTTVATASSAGIFNSSDPENVFKDWDIVHIPYCTGDLHFGSKALEGVDTGFEGIFNQTQCLNQNKTMHLNGFENSKAALAWAKANYPEVDDLVVGGMSAGSLAAQTFAYMGVLPVEHTAGKIFHFSGMCDTDLKLPQSTVDACKAETLTMDELVKASLKVLPKSYWASLNSKSDAIQRYFYQVAKDGILGYPFPNILPEADFYATVTSFLDSYKTVSSHISSIFVDGSQHVFLSKPACYNTVSDARQKLGDFVAQWLSQVTGASDAPSTSPAPTPSSSGC
ncbi:hypothetical protein Poli38472_009973 [Pythium oligandrum]|uniref:Uncharacterized protein n=1 Tax=Pythium oligandrum TaxID=41045 RepID=A0A8K1C8H7_PYTOL|nr:hypothetical protein Poli38472_009973 [Pythium oligandrum]|eukprot:TMW58414.1 hypothetical protein Poli38472_009973 [Pythium oligandrum]